MNNALKSHADIVAEMESGPIPEHRHDREILRYYAHSLDLAHKREIDALDQRCTELNAEVAAKDEVIKRLNDAIAEEQRHKMATAENPSVVGNAAKMREALKQVNELNDLWFDTFTLPDGATSIHDEIEDVISAALAAPPRNCDRPECATLEMATKTWIQEVFGPLCNNSKATMADIRTFDVWIYAPASEK